MANAVLGEGEGEGEDDGCSGELRRLFSAKNMQWPERWPTVGLWMGGSLQTSAFPLHVSPASTSSCVPLGEPLTALSVRALTENCIRYPGCDVMLVRPLVQSFAWVGSAAVSSCCCCHCSLSYQVSLDRKHNLDTSSARGGKAFTGAESGGEIFLPGWFSSALTETASNS